MKNKQEQRTVHVTFQVFAEVMLMKMGVCPYLTPKEELEKLNLDKKSIDKIILNYSLEDIEGKINLLQIKRNVINPAGWLITALQANYLNPESSKEENDEEEKIMETEEMESESKIVKLNKLALKKKEKEEKDRLFMEESLKWVRQNLVQRFEM